MASILSSTAGSVWHFLCGRCTSSLPPRFTPASTPSTTLPTSLYSTSIWLLFSCGLSASLSSVSTDGCSSSLAGEVLPLCSLVSISNSVCVCICVLPYCVLPSCSVPSCCVVTSPM